MRWTLSVFLFLALVMAGCSSPAPKLEVSPKTLAVTANSAAVGPFTATLSNTTGSITWSISPNIGTLSSSTGTSVSYTPPISVASTTTVTLTATSGTLSDTATITVSPPPAITVSGVVKDASNTPLSGIGILLNEGNLQTTGADGSFSYNGVVPPYNLSLKTSSTVIEYRGLSLANLNLLGKYGSFSADISGQINGPSYPIPAGEKILIGASNGIFPVSSNTANASGAFGSNVLWRGSETKTADLVALRVKVVGGQISEYLASGKRTGVNFTDGVGQTGLNINLGSTPVPTVSNTFTYSAGAYGIDLGGGTITAKVGGASFLIGGSSIPSGSTLKIPTEGANLVVSGRDANGNQASIIVPADTSGPNNISLPATTMLQNTAPANAATNVSKRPTLTWTAVPDATLYFVQLTGPGGVDMRFILPASAGSSLELPDLTAFGISLAGSTAYNWSVISVKSPAYLSINDLPYADASIFFLLTAYSGNPLTYFSSKFTTFTTQP